MNGSCLVHSTVCNRCWENRCKDVVKGKEAHVCRFPEGADAITFNIDEDERITGTLKVTRSDLVSLLDNKRITIVQFHKLRRKREPECICNKVNCDQLWRYEVLYVFKDEPDEPLTFFVKPQNVKHVLPDGWESAVDEDSGKLYYWRTKTRIAQWQTPCFACKGNGKTGPLPFCKSNCIVCDGSGNRIVAMYCSTCDGTGKTGYPFCKSDCSECAGSGVLS